MNMISYINTANGFQLLSFPLAFNSVSSRLNLSKCSLKFAPLDICKAYNFFFNGNRFVKDLDLYRLYNFAQSSAGSVSLMTFRRVHAIYSRDTIGSYYLQVLSSPIWHPLNLVPLTNPLSSSELICSSAA